ncbi:hypothetical protein [Phormidium sp. CCY1219]|uniref:hypothetical protein n=1 Tax=Phormidium sp. CCY1219 TaxID=2886104 RepID=UPI002D1EB27C|nr:hypothetical protein [Phormidium sp. CCY1219]MEB3829488.1 hypothetical protein [Phormidium sp. CCY1219]
MGGGGAIAELLPLFGLSLHGLNRAIAVLQGRSPPPQPGNAHSLRRSILATQGDSMGESRATWQHGARRGEPSLKAQRSRSLASVEKVPSTFTIPKP